MRRNDLLARRRASLGMTRAELANRAHVPALLIERLESAATTVDLTVEHARRIADATGLTFEQVAGPLVASRMPNPFDGEELPRQHKAADGPRLLALVAAAEEELLAEDVARALGWDMDRLEAAVDAGRALLAQTGITLRYSPDARLRLGGDTTMVDGAVVLRARPTGQRRYTREQIKVLASIASVDDRPGRRTLHDFAEGDRRIVSELVRDGLVEIHGEVLEMTDAAAESLYPARLVDPTVAWVAVEPRQDPRLERLRRSIARDDA